jgi:hypothetical protein
MICQVLFIFLLQIQDWIFESSLVFCHVSAIVSNLRDNRRTGWRQLSCGLCHTSWPHCVCVCVCVCGCNYVQYFFPSCSLNDNAYSYWAKPFFSQSAPRAAMLKHSSVSRSAQKCGWMSIVQRQQYWRLELPKSPDYSNYDPLERMVTSPVLYSRCVDTCCVYNNVLSFHCIHRCSGKLMTEHALLSYTVSWSKPSLSFKTLKVF